ncbi:MAG TPA: tetratricopeptide repeat protein [Longimicrobium sp.]|uniref:tetratricopeptide repeat protein n=1 Tax=Longimicrobium sp. TaxID=2029185 RepID=UPI002ED85F0E
MRKVKILFFAADPILGRRDGVPLQLLEELRQIQEHVGRARYGHRLHLEPHGAARADDLLEFLEHTDARVVHFSGHGGRHGLGLVAPDGYSVHYVNAAALRRVFREYHGPVRLVVLSACSSDAEAQAVADIVGCAIGTSSTISDDAAITFNSRFYRAVANGYSVERAFEHARTVLHVYNVPESEYPELFVRKGVDPADLVLVKTYRPVPRRVAAAGVVTVITAVFINWPERVLPQLTPSDIACGSQSSSVEEIRPLMHSRGAMAATPAAPAGPAADLATAKALYRDRNYAAAAAAFEKAATAGNGEAMGCLGYMYLYGRGMDRPQPAVGFEWVHKGAADQRDPHAMYALANAYLAGVGTTAREHWARYWFLEAAEQDYAEAMRSLGELERRKTNDSSHREALIWFQKAADAGSIEARVDLGMMLELGRGVARNPVEALKWYRFAAAGGSPRGMSAVGQSYHEGIGVARDYRMAMVWYHRAAKAGSADAMNNIGVLYENGLGVRKDSRIANRWYKRGAKAGSDLAKGNLRKFGQD